MITQQLVPEKDLGIFTIEGSVGRDDLLKIVASFQDRERPKYIIWDATHGTVAKVERDDVRKIARYLKAGHGMRPGGKTALVGPEDLDYGIGRMFQAYANLENLTVEYKMFRNLDAAMTWIDSLDE